MSPLALALALAAGPPAAPPQDPGSRFEAANALYLAGDADGAARAYQALLADGWDGAALHHNLGNALLRAGHRGHAMASWARAIRLDPSDADARANLEAARALNVDRVVGASEPPLWRRLVERTPDGLALCAFGLPWVALWTLLWLRGRSARRARALLGAGALAAAALSLAGGALLAGRVAARSTPAAMVVAEEAPVREGPSRTLRAAFEVHEGTEVRVLEARGDLARVRLQNGLEGWVAAADLDVI